MSRRNGVWGTGEFKIDDLVSFDFWDMGEFHGYIVDTHTYPTEDTREDQWLIQPLQRFLSDLATEHQKGKPGFRPGRGADLEYLYDNMWAGRFPNGQVFHILPCSKLRKPTDEWRKEHDDWIRSFRLQRCIVEERESMARIKGAGSC